MPGRLPVVPRQPPPLLPGATADRAFKVFLFKLAVAVGAVLVLVELVQLPGWPNPSPHRQAERELWTGAAWSNQYEGG